jgi:hypothetical protein
MFVTIKEHCCTTNNYSIFIRLWYKQKRQEKKKEVSFLMNKLLVLNSKTQKHKTIHLLIE